MARMIPPVFDESVPSPGERRLFERLQRDPGTDGWTVLHSLNLADHPSQVCGEVDFVVVAPGQGVLCLEVKAHRRIARDTDGNWLLGGRPAVRSPFVQADGQMRAVMRFLRTVAPDLADVPVLSAVWFTNCRARVGSSVEWHDWQLLDQGDLSRSVALTLTELFHAGRAHLTAKAGKEFGPGPDERACKRIVQALRPEFEFVSTPDSVRDERARQVLKFTEEQYDALDTMERSTRVLFSGHAGTGKTFLALEAASRAVQRGQSVLLLCYNRLLASWLRAVAPAGVEVATLHSFMCRIADVKPEPAAPDAWWREQLPELAVDAMLEIAAPAAEVLIVDEAQDLMAQAYLDVLDLSVVGGLAAGNWRMFGDFERQAIFQTGDGVASLTARARDAVQYMLTKNCRNSPRVGMMAATLAGIRPGYRGFRRPDDGVNVAFSTYASGADEERLLATALRRMADDGFAPEDIVVLSPSASGVAESTRNLQLRAKLCRLDQPLAGRARYGTVHSFKGLDAPAVIVTDIRTLSGQAAEDLLYIAMTRSTGPLTVLLDAENAQEVAKLVLGGAADA